MKVEKCDSRYISWEHGGDWCVRVTLPDTLCPHFDTEKEAQEWSSDQSNVAKWMEILKKEWGEKAIEAMEEEGR